MASPQGFKFSTKTLIIAASHFLTDEKSAIQIYGHPEQWDCSDINDEDRKDIVAHLNLFKHLKNNAMTKDASTQTDDSTNVLDGLVGTKDLNKKENEASYDFVLDVPTTSVTENTSVTHKPNLEEKLTVIPPDVNNPNIYHDGVLMPNNKGLRILVNRWFNNKKQFKENYNSLNLLDTRRVTNMSRLFKDKHDFNEYIGGWDLINVTNIDDMFNGASSYDQIMSFWDVYSVKYMSRFLKNAKSYRTCIECYWGYKLGNVVKNKDMYEGADNINFDVVNNNTIRPIINRWFKNKNKTEELFGPLCKLNVTHVTNMDGLFKNRYEFNEKLNWDMENVVSTAEMFYGCTNYSHTIKWKTYSLKDTFGMFVGCENLTEVSLILSNSRNKYNDTDFYSLCEREMFLDSNIDLVKHRIKDNYIEYGDSINVDKKCGTTTLYRVFNWIYADEYSDDSDY